MEMFLFDGLPAELRDHLNNGPVNWCTHCVHRLYRKVGAGQTLAQLRAQEAAEQQPRRRKR
jgi:Family of unknown function (DUF6525)